MKDTLKILDPVKSIITLTEKMESKKKFAYVNISRSAINAANNVSEKKPPKYFMKAISKCFSIEDENFLKAIPVEFSRDIEKNELSSIGLKNNGVYYDANMFDYFFANKKEVVDIFINHYIRDSKNLVLSFHDKKIIEKIFGSNQYVVTIPYNNYYDKLDSIVSQIKEFSNEIDSCILDCPMLSTAISPKIWEETEVSIIDFGKVVSSAKFIINQEKNKREEAKKFHKKNYEKRR